MKIEEAIERFLDYIAVERRLSKKTVALYGDDLHLFETYVRERQKVSEIEEVTHIEIREWIMSEQGKSPFTVKQYVAVLRSWYKYLRREGIVTVDVMAKVSTPKTPKRLPITFTEREANQIYKTEYFGEDFEGVRDQLVLRILYETGIRRAEVIGLTTSSVDKINSQIKVLGKRDKERIIPIERELVDNIGRYLALREEVAMADEKAFFVKKNGKRFTAEDVAKVVKKYMLPVSQAERVSPHIFRHSFATHLLNDGADINAIKELLGHTDLRATEVYTHVTRQYMQETYKHTHPRAMHNKKTNED